MKRILMAVFFSIMASLCYAQSNDTTIYSEVDELPVFPEEDSVLINFIEKNFVYSENARQQGTIAKTTRVSFVVTSTGKIKNAKVVEPDKKTSSFDNEIASVIEKMPDWKPGKKNGVPVNVKYLLDVFIDTKYKPYYMASYKQRYYTSGLYFGKRNVVITDITLNSYRKTKADAAYNSGVKKTQEGNYQGAVDDFNEALKYNPNDIDALYNRGAMKYKLKDKDGACADWNAIKSLGKNDADALLTKYCENK